MPSRVGIVTADPLRVAEELESKGIEFFLLYGENKPGEDTCFVTLTPIDDDYQDILQKKEGTTGFALLRNGGEFVNYIKEYISREVADAIHQYELRKT